MRLDKIRKFYAMEYVINMRKVKMAKNITVLLEPSYRLLDIHFYKKVEFNPDYGNLNVCTTLSSMYNPKLETNEVIISYCYQKEDTKDLVELKLEIYTKGDSFDTINKERIKSILYDGAVLHIFQNFSKNKKPIMSTEIQVMLDNLLAELKQKAGDDVGVAVDLFNESKARLKTLSDALATGQIEPEFFGEKMKDELLVLQNNAIALEMLSAASVKEVVLGIFTKFIQAADVLFVPTVKPTF